MHASWQLFVIRGVLAILFGIAALVWPGPALVAVIFLLGIFLLVDAALALTFALRYRAARPRSWWILGLYVAFGLVAAIIAFSAPLLAAMLLTVLIAAWAVITGVLTIAWAIEVRREIDNEWSIGIGGALAILFGVLLVAWPGSGLLAMIWLLGVFMLATGVAHIALGLRLRKLRQQIHAAEAELERDPPRGAHPA